MKNYKVTKIKSKKRSFLTAINQEISPNVNEIELSLEREYKFLWLFPMKEIRTRKFSLHIKYDINDYLKVGDTFNEDKLLNK